MIFILVCMIPISFLMGYSYARHLLFEIAKKEISTIQDRSFMCKVFGIPEYTEGPLE